MRHSKTTLVYQPANIPTAAISFAMTVTNMGNGHLAPKALSRHTCTPILQFFYHSQSQQIRYTSVFGKKMKPLAIFMHILNRLTLAPPDWQLTYLVCECPQDT